MPQNYEPFVRLFLLLQLILGILAQFPIRINDNLAANSKYVYTLNAQFDDDILATWSNEEITMLAQQAYGQMVSRVAADKARYPRFKKPSPLVTAIVTGHSVYFSSTLTGGGSLQYVPNQNCPYKDQWTPGNRTPQTSCALVYVALLACQMRSSNNSGHRAGGNCGEVMAAMNFCTVNPNGSLAGAKIVTWGEYRSVESVWDPCVPLPDDLASIDIWGCSSFAKTLDMVVIGKGTNPSNRAIPNYASTYSPLT